MRQLFKKPWLSGSRRWRVRWWRRVVVMDDGGDHGRRRRWWVATATAVTAQAWDAAAAARPTGDLAAHPWLAWNVRDKLV